MNRESVAAVREPDPDVAAAELGPESTIAQRSSLALVRDESRREELDAGRTDLAPNLAPAATDTLPATTEPNAPNVPEDEASIPPLPIRQRSRSTQSLPPCRPIDRPAPDIMRRVLSALHRL